MIRLAALLVSLCMLLLGAAEASSASAAPYLPPKGKVFAGTTGGRSLGDFPRLSGKHPAVFQSFAPWDAQGSWWIDVAERARSRPMVHISTKTISGREGITPRGIALGRADAHLMALTKRIARSGQITYVRLMSEMNGSWNLYSAYTASGRSKGRSHTTRMFKLAWKRTVLILRGGPVQTIDRRLHALRLPGLRASGSVLPRPRVAIMWVPQVWGDPDIPQNSARAYWPGSRYVDWVGTDFYSKFPNFRGLDAFYREFRHKPFVFGEWALWDSDDPGFVNRLFSWARSHPRVKMLMYNQGSRPEASPLRLARYPRAARALRHWLASPRFAPFAPELKP